MHDAHFHFSKELFDSLKTYSMTGVCNIENAQEYAQIQGYRQIYPFHYSCGIHPWHVDTVNYDSFFPYLKKADVIGEIGLDNTWCDTDLLLQKEVFEKQLQYASSTRKPVILHLKGMEKEALEFLRKYPNIYIVHWYSCMEYLEEYIDLDCYFTIGPSIGIDACVDQVAQKVRLDRLLMESDGLSAIEWVFSKEKEYISTMKRSLEKIAEIKKRSVEEIEKQLDKNFNTLFGRG